MAYYALLALVILAPLPLGSNRPIPELIVQAWCFGILTLTALLAASGRLSDVAKRLRHIAPIIWLYLIWLLVFIIQMFPLPPSVAELLSPRAFEAYSQLSSQGEQVSYFISVDRYETFRAFLFQISFFALFVSAYLLMSSQENIRRAFMVMFFFCLFEVVLAVLALPVGERVGLGDESKLGILLSGTYVNPNHFAGLLEMGLGIGIGLIRLRQPHGYSLKGQFVWLMHEPTLFVPLVILLVGLLFTGSRGGVIAFSLAFLITEIVFRFRAGKERPSGAFWSVIATIVVLALVLGGGSVIEKTLAKGGDTYRPSIWQASLETGAKHPLLGAGGGAYEVATEALKPPALAEKRLDHAHNDYLELFVEFGLVGVVLAVAALWVAGRRLYSQAVFRSASSSALMYGVSVSLLSLLLHGLVDFNFNIPANALWFSVLLAIGLSLDFNAHQRHRGI